MSDKCSQSTILRLRISHSSRAACTRFYTMSVTWLMWLICLRKVEEKLPWDHPSSCYSWHRPNPLPKTTSTQKKHKFSCTCDPESCADPFSEDSQVVATFTPSNKKKTGLISIIGTQVQQTSGITEIASAIAHQNNYHRKPRADGSKNVDISSAFEQLLYLCWRKQKKSWNMILFPNDRVVFVESPPKLMVSCLPNL